MCRINSVRLLSLFYTAAREKALKIVNFVNNIMKIKNFFRLIFSRLPRNYIAYRLAKKYVSVYEDFSYEPNCNGELFLLNALKDFRFDVVFDVGANVGAWTSRASEAFPGAEIHAFELSKKTFDSLTARCGQSEFITLNNLGLSDQNGEVQYIDYGANSGLNTLVLGAKFHDAENQPELTRALVCRGDEYCKEHGVGTIDFLKIDVEGAEKLVLGGFHQMLALGEIKVIQFEYGYTHGDSRFLMRDFFDLFEGYGYVIGPLKRSGVIFSKFRYRFNDFNSGPNYVAVHKSHRHIIEKIRGRAMKGYLS